MSESLIIENLTKTYPSFTLKNVSFQVPQGFIMGFIGPNGSGKTTTLKSILELIRPDGGTISNPHQKEDIGIVMDGELFVEDWNMLQVEQAVSLFYPNWDSPKYAKLLQQFGIDSHKKVKELSRGMKVKLMLAVAFSHHAKLLILDEPTSGLDPVARDEICDLLAEFVENDQHSVLFSTHITSDLERVADYITFLLGGQVVFTGPKDELLSSFAIVKGDLLILEPPLLNILLGTRQHATGFEALVKVEHLKQLPSNILIHQPTLEEIIIFMNREAKTHE